MAAPTLRDRGYRLQAAGRLPTGAAQYRVVPTTPYPRDPGLVGLISGHPGAWRAWALAAPTHLHPRPFGTFPTRTAAAHAVADHLEA